MFLPPTTNRPVPAQLDEELIRNYRREGQPHYFTELFHRHTGLIYRVCNQYLSNEEDCRDTVMRTFEKCLRYISSREVQHFSRWLCLLARNECIDQLRAIEKRSAASTTYHQLLTTSQPYYSEKMVMKIHLIHLLDQLREEQRICIELFFYEDKSYREISRATGFSEKKVKSHLQNGKRRLRLMLEKRMEKNETWGVKDL